MIGEASVWAEYKDISPIGDGSALAIIDYAVE
jgi:hypothetical protein